MFKCPAIIKRGEDLIYSSFLGSKIDLGHQIQIIWACPNDFGFIQRLFITEFRFWHAMIHYLKNKVGVVDFANVQGLVMF